MTFGERLVYAREMRGYNQKTFAMLLDVTPTRLNYWEKDKREPDVLMIWKIISLLKISGNWLIGGEGEIELTKKAPAISGSDIQKQKLMENYEKLNPLGQEKLVDYSEDLTGNEKYTQTEAVFSAKEA